MLSKMPQLSLVRSTCDHRELWLTTSSYGKEAGYHQPSAQQRALATILARSQDKGRKSQKRKRTTTSTPDSAEPTQVPSPKTFPAPLLLPGDDLAEDPDYEPQSYEGWANEPLRNPVTAKRNVVYIATPPTIGKPVTHIAEWTKPLLSPARLKRSAGIAGDIVPPAAGLVHEYLKAFYTGLEVRSIADTSKTLTFTIWKDGKKRDKGDSDRFIGLKIGAGEIVRIRTRHIEDAVFARQLNLDDLLDAMIGALPSDAYALLLLVNHDLYENEEDDFTCGRAYGGSRVSVVSTARYHPGLDIVQGVDRLHSWPASHCAAYVQTCCEKAIRGKRKPKHVCAPERARKNSTPPLEQNNSVTGSTRNVPIDLPSTSEPQQFPLEAAIQAIIPLSQKPEIQNPLYIWLFRVCITASHELGHCFGLDHCVYYACAMQGTYSLAEDVRQPPYLCPVCSAKLTAATGAGEKERLQSVRDWCCRLPGMVKFVTGGSVEDCGSFAALTAWASVRIEELCIDEAGEK